MIRSIAILTLLNAFHGLSQSDSLEYYFDDGGLSNTKNLLKLDVTGWLGGDYAIHYERAVTKVLSLEGGFGVWTGKNLLSHPYVLNHAPPYDPTFSYKFRAKLYYLLGGKGGAPQYLYNALMFRHRYTIVNDKSSVDYSRADFYDLLFQTGFQYFFIKRLVLECNVGFGVSMRNLKYPVMPAQPATGSQTLVYNMGLKFGYRF